MADDDAQSKVGTGGWEAMERNLAADQVLAEGHLYAAGWRQLAVQHDSPLTADARALLERLAEQIQHVVRLAGATEPGTVTYRTGSATWAFPTCERTARQHVVLARLVADQLNPGGWTVTADDYP